jgi:hypothetical protein
MTMTTTNNQRDPGPLELQRFNELFTRDPLEAVQFAKARGFAVDPDVLSDSHEIADERLGTHEIIRSAAAPEIAQRALSTRAAKYLLTNGETPADAVKRMAVEAVGADDIDGMDRAIKLAEEFELTEWRRDCFRQRMTMREKLDVQSHARGRAVADAGGRESAARMIAETRSAERVIREKYGMDGAEPSFNPSGRDHGPTDGQRRAFERELGEARQRIAADHTKRIEAIEAHLDNPDTNPEPPRAA